MSRQAEGGQRKNAPTPPQEQKTDATLRLNNRGTFSKSFGISTYFWEGGRSGAPGVGSGDIGMLGSMQKRGNKKAGEAIRQSGLSLTVWALGRAPVGGPGSLRGVVLGGYRGIFNSNIGPLGQRGGAFNAGAKNCYPLLRRVQTFRLLLLKILS